MEPNLLRTKASYLLSNPAPTGLCYNNLLTSAIIFHPTSPTPKVLLLQRASHKPTSPNTFELPGGLIEDRDPTILDGLKREVRQKIGLRVERVETVVEKVCFAVEKDVWNGGERVVVRKLSLLLGIVIGLVDYCGTVRLFAEDHSRGLWVEEGEVPGLAMVTEETRGMVESAFRWREGKVVEGETKVEKTKEEKTKEEDVREEKTKEDKNQEEIKEQETEKEIKEE